MTKAAAQTGSGPTTVVAVEQSTPIAQRIIDDYLAYHILPAGERAFAWLARFAPLRNWVIRASEKSAPGIWGGVLCRKRYIDDMLVEAAGTIDAVVNLGAGFDTRPYRLPALAAIRTWEVDQPDNIRVKQARLLRRLGAIPANVTLVPIDFDHANLADTLTAYGYKPALRTFFIWEAVTQYLTEAGIQSTFAFLAQAAPGSRLAFTYVRQDFIAGRERYGQDAIYTKYVVKEKSWLSGFAPDDIGDILQRVGWTLVEHLGYDELAARYVSPTGRDLTSSPLERMVYAEKL